MVAKPIQIGDELFPRRLDAENFFREMLAQYEDDEKISEADSRLLYELLLRHPQAEAKMGAGIAHFFRAPGEYRKSCFHIERIDGSIVDFSFYVCVKGTATPLNSKFASACRAAVGRDMAAEKDRLLAKGPDEPLCPVTGRVLTSGTSLLRHASPPFEAIVSAFIKDRQLTLDEAMVVPSTELRYGDALASPRLAAQFLSYHRAKRQVILVHSSVGPKAATLAGIELSAT